MRLAQTIRISTRQLYINKSRSVFAALALSLGVAAVVTMAAIGNGAKAETLKQLEQLGTNLITVNAGKVMSVVSRKDSTDKMTTLRMRDCELILSAVSSPVVVVPSIDGTRNVKSDALAYQCLINGVTPAYFSIKNFYVQYGNLFTCADNTLSRRVAILGSDVNLRLFNGKNPVGKTILIGKAAYEISGVLKSKGMNAEGGNLDAQVIVPLNTAMRRIFNLDYLNHIFISVANRSLMKSTENEIISALRHGHRLDIRNKENDFTVDNQITALETSADSAQSFTWIILGVSSLALLVGGTGIMAVMLLSVKMRNEEIGLRISLGAKRKDITRQFLIESTMLGFAGGLTGVLSGMVFSWIMLLASAWEIIITPLSVIIPVLFSVTAGLVFGVIPARKASRADPIKALQKE
jgi:putative ABC transport system permease protein